MLWLLTQHILVVTFLVLVVSLVCRLTRLAPAAQYVLWLVVAVKLMTPPIVTWPWSIEDVAEATFPARAKIIERSASAGGLHTDSLESRAHLRSWNGLRHLSSELRCPEISHRLVPPPKWQKHPTVPW